MTIIKIGDGKSITNLEDMFRRMGGTSTLDFESFRHGFATALLHCGLISKHALKEEAGVPTRHMLQLVQKWSTDKAPDA